MRDDEVRTAQEGDPVAAEAVLRRLLPRVRKLVRYMMRGDSDVDDLAQESLILILRGLKSFQGQGSLEAWADRIVARRVIDEFRRRKRLPTVDPDLEVVGDPDRMPDVEEDRRRALLLLDRLPDVQRVALVLHYVAEMSVAEVGEQMGVPLETVRTRLRRGRAALTELREKEKP